MRSRPLIAAVVAITLTLGLGGCSVLDQLRANLGEPPVSSPGVVAADVVRVIDGDTIAVRASDQLPATNSARTEHSVRLLGIDTPELNAAKDAPAECGAHEATDHLTSIIGERVLLTFDSRSDRIDRYGRSLAYVASVDPVVADLALEMAAAGYAGAWYPRGEPEPERFGAYAAAEAAASASGTGAHGSCGALGR